MARSSAPSALYPRPGLRSASTIGIIGVFAACSGSTGSWSLPPGGLFGGGGGHVPGFATPSAPPGSQLVTRLACDASWSADGTEIYYQVHDGDDASSLKAVNVNTMMTRGFVDAPLGTDGYMIGSFSVGAVSRRGSLPVLS